MTINQHKKIKMKKLLLCTSLLGSMFVSAQTYFGNVVLTSSGTVPISLEVEVNKTTEIVNFTFKGPESRYYAVGFDALSMSDAPYTLLTQEATVQERKLTGGRSSGNLLAPAITLVSDEVDTNDMRTIVFTRALMVSDDYFDFSSITDGTQLNLIWAEGASLDIVTHTRRGVSNISFVEGVVLSVDDISRSDSSYIQLYPNPVQTILAIDNYEKLTTVEVYDTRYSKIASYDAVQTKGQIDMEELSSGTYFVKCTGVDGTTVTEMLIKN